MGMLTCRKPEKPDWETFCSYQLRRGTGEVSPNAKGSGISSRGFNGSQLEGTCLPYTVQGFNQFYRCKSIQLALAGARCQGSLQL